MTLKKEPDGSEDENTGGKMTGHNGGGKKTGDTENTVSLDITVILDRSGSMEEIRDDAIGSFNAFLTDKQEKNPTALMSLVLFDDQYLVREDASPIQDVKNLTHETYIPRGSTALLDALGRTVQAIEERDHVDEEVLIAVLTDGQENSSGEYTLEQIRRIITQKEEKGWDFVYLSANQSAFTDAQKIGFDRSKTAFYAKNCIQDAYHEMDAMMLSKMEKVRQHRRMKETMQEKTDTMYQ